MNFQIQQIADWIGAEVVGDPNQIIDHFSAIEEGTSNGISFLANPKYENYLYTTEASAVIISKELTLKEKTKATLLKVEDPYSAFAQLLRAYEAAIKPEYIGVDSLASIHETAVLESSVYVGAYSVIEGGANIKSNTEIHAQTYIGRNVVIGEGCEVHPGVKIYGGTIIGNNVVIHSNSVIGAPGFGFSPNSDGGFDKIPQLGKVVIEDNVDIGSSCTIDRATFGETRISQGVKLDNQVHLAHNVFIGENTVIAAQTGIAGSTKIGNKVMIGGQAGIVGHIEIGDEAKIQAQSGVTRNVKTNEKVQGTPAIDYTTFSKSYIHFKNLVSLDARVRELEQPLNKTTEK
jgi:UDP-3-O-[3-hydroxymyristoyl] glucosamine N-acyltransferase